MNIMDTESTSIIDNILAKIFEPLTNYLHEIKITGALIGFILASIGVYFQVFYKRPKGLKIQNREVFILICWFIFFFITLMSQLDVLYPPKTDLERHRERIEKMEQQMKK